MNRTMFSLLAAALLSTVCMSQSSADMQSGGSASQNTSASAGQSGAQVNSSTSTDVSQHTTASGKNGDAHASSLSNLQSGSTVQAELTKPADARKNKPGDEVTAKTTQDVKSDGKVLLAKGSKIVGKVTQAQSRTKGQAESQLGIAFDHAILKDGTQIPVSFAIQAISNSQAAGSAAAAEDSAAMEGNVGGMANASGSSGNRGLVSGAAGNVVNTAGNTAGATLHPANATGANVAGGLTSSSRGVVGMPGLTLSSAASSSTSAGSVISSTSSNVRLDSGTRMLLRVNGQ
jgi:hypothetical protein